MANLLKLQTHNDARGNLTVINDIEKELPFKVKRIFYIYQVDNSERGGHRHKKTFQAAICVNGSCTISNDDGIQKEKFKLSSPSECLILEPKDWHTMNNFSENAVLLVFASESFDANDYIYEKYL